MIDDPARRKGLGRGLAALLGEDAAEDYAQLDKLRIAKEVPIEQLQPNRFQPRHRFDNETMSELVASILQKGVLQPIIVRRTKASTTYEIIAGERRWRAAQQAKLHQVPVVIKDLTDSESLEVALIENIQRENLNPIEEAEGFRRLLEEFSYTQEQLASVVGKSRSQVANTLRLLDLPAPVKAMLEEGRLSAGHGRALIGADNAEALARQIADSGLTVRQAEDLSARAKPVRRRPRAAKAADTLALERDLSAATGMKIAIRHKAEGQSGQSGGEVTIYYRTLEQLEDICRRLSRPAGKPGTGEQGV
jgi:ParB family chromosome partitioning protein